MGLVTPRKADTRTQLMTTPKKRLSSQIMEHYFEGMERINSKLAMADVDKLYEVGQKCQLFQEYKSFAG